MRSRLRVNGREQEIAIERSGDDYRAEVGGREIALRVRPLGDGLYGVEADGRPLLAWVARDRDRLLLHLGGRTYEVDERGASPRRTSGAAGDLRAPMTATVARLLARVGERVVAGQPVVVLEAMKMEMTVRATHAGVVRTLPYGEGDVVGGGEIVAEIGDAGPA